MDVGSAVTLGFVSVIALLWYIWRKKRMTLFERLGIPGPKPHFITGNVNNTSEQAALSIEWEKKYGKIFGIYMGAWPFLIVSDIELLRLVQIKEFKIFPGRAKFFSDLAIPNDIGLDSMFTKSGEKWKNARSAISPAFTTGKLKKMMPIATEVMDIFLSKIAETNQKTFDIAPLFRKMSLDANTRASFGISTDVQNSDDTLFIRSMYRSFDADSVDMLAKMIVYFPELHQLPQMLRILRDKIRSILNFPSASAVIESCAKIINIRKNNPKQERPDLLQGLIDASRGFSSSNVQESIKKAISSHMPLTENEVLANAFGFMLAGFDVIGVMLAFCTHYLVDNPEVQDKLREEIKEKVKGKVEYDDLINLPYLDQVISETLRMFPFPMTGIHRTSAEEYKYKGITIPKGMNIGIALHSLNMDPNYWEAPEEFKPERFSPENGEINSMIYQPFGAGPRNCVGMRFAQVFMKTMIVILFQKYKIVKPADGKEFELEYNAFFVRPKNGVQVRAIPV